MRLQTLLNILVFLFHPFDFCFKVSCVFLEPLVLLLGLILESLFLLHFIVQLEKPVVVLSQNVLTILDHIVDKLLARLLALLVVFHAPQLLLCVSELIFLCL